jgi:hypothetical protein
MQKCLSHISIEIYLYGYVALIVGYVTSYLIDGIAIVKLTLHAQP